MNLNLKIKNICLIVLLLSLFTFSQAYCYIYDGKHWPGPNPMGELYLINPNCADSEAGTSDDQIIAIGDGAARAWMNEGNANFTFTYGGTTTKPLPDDGKVSSYDGFNQIMFVQDADYWLFQQNPSIIAVVWTWYYTGSLEIFECDMAFNDVNYTFNGVGQPTSSEMDIWDIATHELGHFLKLKDLYDAADSEKTMYGYVAFGETKSRDLHPDDIAGIQYIYGAAANTNPVLSASSVSPGSGYIDTNFIFSVNYYDANEDSPTVQEVYIDGSPSSMSIYSGIPSNGTYRYQTTLPRGSHNYYFYFQEAQGGSDREPVLWSKTGPTVVNRAPTLSGGSVNPTVGTIGKLFNFYVTYTDLDGDTPTVANVVIDGLPYNMALYSGSGANGTYQYQTSFSSIGNHNFYFSFEDGFGGSARFPTSGTLAFTVYKCGDVNFDNKIDLADVIYLANYVIKNGPSPIPVIAGDVTGNGKIDLADVIYLANYVIKTGPAPVCP